MNVLFLLLLLLEIEKETIKYEDLIAELKKLREDMRALKVKAEDKLKKLIGCNPGVPFEQT